MRLAVCFIVGALWVGCSTSEETPQVPESDANVALDEGPPVVADEGPAIADEGSPPLDGGTPPVDAGPVEPDDPCVLRCAPYSECGDGVTVACARTCDDEEVALCEDGCLANGGGCAMAEQCFGVVAPGGEAWTDSGFGVQWRNVANEFVIPTLKGDWSFATEWTGHDNYVFVMTQTGFEPGQQLWTSEPFYLLDESPPNAHYFFMAYNDGNGVDDAAAHMTEMKERLEPVLYKLGQIRGLAAECRWRRQIHYVPVSAWGLDNWVSSMLQARPVLAFGIDRFQRIRPAGLLSLVQGTPLLKHLQYLPEYFNFELKREQEKWAGEQTTVTVYDGAKVNGADAMVDFPSAEEMATFDTLEIDLSQYCDAHDDQNCFEWDYKAFINVRERPLVEENASAEVACQGEVKLVEAQEEAMGTCPDEAPCSTDEDCSGDAVCEGYLPLIEPLEPIAADTLSCECVVPGQSELRDTTQTCKADGTGFADCACNEQWEIARWITSYHREGRWVMDASALLPLLDSGGKTRLRFKGSYPYTTTLHFNFSNRGKPDRAKRVQRLFGGGGFGPGYSDKYEPMEFEIPATTTRTEVFAWITGHGFGGQPYNCAEFCNHTHHFTVNGGEHVHGHNHINDYYGCAKQVSQGTVPNQFGTWTIGRGGWCPGKDVTPFVADVSADITANTTITYKGLLEETEWQEGDEGFGGSIWMTSYLITYE